MLNKKGFTVIELIMSFTFSSILAISLFAVVMNYRNKEMDFSIKNDLLAFKSQVIIDIQKDIQAKGLNHIDYCMEENPTTHELTRVGRCIILYFNDSTSKEFVVKEDVRADSIEHPDGSADNFYYSIPYIAYGGIRYTVPDAANVSIRNNFILEQTSLNDGIESNIPLYKIRVEFIHNDLDADIDISVVCNGTRTESASSNFKSYSVGDEVLIQVNATTQKKFVVIKDSSKNNAYLTLLYNDSYDSLVPSSISFNSDIARGNDYSNSVINEQVSEIANLWKNARKVRLLSFEEASFLVDACPYFRNTIKNASDPTPYFSLSSSYSWIKSSSFWTSSGREYDVDHPNYAKRVWIISSSDEKLKDVNVNESYGLRPVIEISKIYDANS